MIDRSYIPTFDDVLAARRRIEGVVRGTPAMRFEALSDLIDGSAWLKCENLQVGGAFKYRGATNAVLSLDDATSSRGVATHSSGNHGACLGLAAKRRGIAAHVVVPMNVSPTKLRLIEATGASVTFCEPDVTAREAALAAIVERTGATVVHPYDDALVIAGQGTATLELMEDVRGLDAIVAPISGGGLMSGTAIAAHGVDATAELIGAEPALAADAAESLRSRALLPALPTSGTTMADGLRAALCARTFEVLRVHVRHVVTVSEDQIAEAMRYTLEHTGMRIEPSAAVAIAAVRADLPRFEGRRVGIIVTGGNIEAT